MTVIPFYPNSEILKHGLPKCRKQFMDKFKIVGALSLLENMDLLPEVGINILPIKHSACATKFIQQPMNSVTRMRRCGTLQDF